MTKPQKQPAKTQWQRTKPWRASAEMVQLNVMVPNEVREKVRKVAAKAGQKPANLVAAWAEAGCPTGSSAVMQPPAAGDAKREAVKGGKYNGPEQQEAELNGALSEARAQLLEFADELSFTPTELVEHILQLLRGQAAERLVLNGRDVEALQFLVQVYGRRDRDELIEDELGYLRRLVQDRLRLARKTAAGKQLIDGGWYPDDVC